MTLESEVAMIPDLRTAIGYVFSAYGKPLDDVAAKVYEHQLADIPLPLLRRVVLDAPATRKFCPSVYELREDCERLRVERLAPIVFEPCVVCRELHPGWDVVVDPDGFKRYMRCRCWREHWARLEGAGLPARSLLPSAAPVDEATPKPAPPALPAGPIDPRMAKAMNQLGAIADAHQMPPAPTVRERRDDD